MADHAVIRRILVFLRSDDLVVPQRGGLRRLGQGQTAEGTVRAAGVARAGAGGLDRVVGDGLMRDGGGISRRGHGAADGADRAREAAGAAGRCDRFRHGLMGGAGARFEGEFIVHGVGLRSRPCRAADDEAVDLRQTAKRILRVDRAISERLIANVGDAGRDGNALALAIGEERALVQHAQPVVQMNCLDIRRGEGVAADKAHGIRQDDALAGAVVECLPADVLHAAEVDELHILRTGEGVVIHIFAALREDQPREIRLVEGGVQLYLTRKELIGDGNRTVPEAQDGALRHRALVGIGGLAEIDHAVRLIVEPAAVLEGPRTDVGHVLFQLAEVGQRGAAGEAAISDLADIPAALDGAQTGAAAEHTVAERNERIRQRHALERNAVAERAARQNADVLQVDRLEVGVAVLVVVGVAVGDRAAHLEHVVGQNHVRRPADAKALQRRIALRDGQILDLVTAGKAALLQNRRRRQLEVGQMGKFSEIDVMDALRNGKLGDAAAAFRDAERFQPVGQDQLVHAGQTVLLDAHHFCAGTDGQLGGVFFPLAAEEHAAAV